MSSKTELMEQQRRWAASVGLSPDSRGYLKTVEENLFAPLNDATKLAFEQGSGSELVDTPSRPAKMKALHSSSALAVNVFDSWVGQDTSSLGVALGLEAEIGRIRFEAQFPTGLAGNPPNLDVALELVDGHVVGIESKFSEWLTAKSKRVAPFKPKYLPAGRGLWASQSLSCSQRLAEAIYAGDEVFQFLDAPQLLKHALGLAVQCDAGFSLLYLYLDWPGPGSGVHRQEIQRFTNAVDPGLRFRALSYQDLFSSLDSQTGVNATYLNYLRNRYTRTV